MAGGWKAPSLLNRWILLSADLKNHFFYPVDGVTYGPGNLFLGGIIPTLFKQTTSNNIPEIITSIVCRYGIGYNSMNTKKTLSVFVLMGTDGNIFIPAECKALTYL